MLSTVFSTWIITSFLSQNPPDLKKWICRGEPRIMNGLKCPKIEQGTCPIDAIPAGYDHK